MPKLQRWLVASKMVTVLTPETLKKIAELGGHVGGGWNEIHQHVCVNQDNKEAIEKILLDQGFRLSTPQDTNVWHPEYHKAHQQHSEHTHS